MTPDPSRVARRFLADTGWDVPLTYEHFRADPEAGKLYGAYTFWLMHDDGTPAQKRKHKPLQTALERKDFNQWGVVIDRWPEAAKEYLRLCRKYRVKPEAVR